MGYKKLFKLKDDYKRIAIRQFVNSPKTNDINYVPILCLFIRLLKRANLNDAIKHPNGPQIITCTEFPIYQVGPPNQMDEHIKWLHFNWFLTAQFPRYHNVWELSFDPVYFNIVEIGLPIKRNGVRSLSYDERYPIHELFNFTCVYCGEKSEEIDHVIPVNRGGTNEKSNLVASCMKCNRVKKDRLLEELGWVMNT